MVVDFVSLFVPLRVDVDTEMDLQESLFVMSGEPHLSTAALHRRRFRFRGDIGHDDETDEIDTHLRPAVAELDSRRARRTSDSLLCIITTRPRAHSIDNRRKREELLFVVINTSFTEG